MRIALGAIALLAASAVLLPSCGKDDEEAKRHVRAAPAMPSAPPSPRERVEFFYARVHLRRADPDWRQAAADMASHRRSGAGRAGQAGNRLPAFDGPVRSVPQEPQHFVERTADVDEPGGHRKAPAPARLPAALARSRKLPARHGGQRLGEPLAQADLRSVHALPAREAGPGLPRRARPQRPPAGPALRGTHGPF